MSWVGFLQFPEDVRYLIENIIPKLNEKSTKEEWLGCLYGLKKYKKHYIWNEAMKTTSTIYPSCRWSIIHHAAHFQAPLSVLQKISVDQFPLSLTDGEGKIALDHLGSKASKDAKALLTPSYKMNYLQLELKLLQANFHEVILERVATLVQKYNLILPMLSKMN